MRVRALAVAAVAAAAVGTVALAPLAQAQGPTNLTTYDYNNVRSGDAPDTSPVTTVSANAVWDAGLDGSVYGQPLVWDGQVIVGTENDSLYGVSLSTGHIAWRTHLGTAVTLSVVDTAPTLNNGCGDIDPLGITGTPVINASTGIVYAVGEVLVDGNRWTDIHHELFAVSLSTHRVLWHRYIDPPHGNNGAYYYIPAEQQRPALTLANNRVYVGLGGLDGDCGQYHGYEVGIPEGGTGPAVVYQVPSPHEAAIWETNGAVVSSAGDLFVATGNGAIGTGHYDGSDGVIELSPTLHEIAEWAPTDWVALSNADWDLGSAGPIAVPGSSLIFVAGKPTDTGSYGFLLSGTHLGHGPGAPVYQGALCQGGGVFGADAAFVVTAGSRAGTYIYAACGSGTAAVKVTFGAHPRFTHAWYPSTGSPNGPPIVAGGYVWALDWNNNILYGMNPTTGNVVFQRNTDGVQHFTSPTFDDGYLLIPTDGGVEAFTAN